MNDKNPFVEHFRKLASPEQLKGLRKFVYPERLMYPQEVYLRLGDSSVYVNRSPLTRFGMGPVKFTLTPYTSDPSAKLQPADEILLQLFEAVFECAGS